MSVHETGTIPVVASFDYMSEPELLADMWGRWDELREQYRFFRADFGPEPIVVMTRYDDVHEAFQDPELFSSVAVAVNDPVGAHRWIPEELDPPEHGKYRQILMPFFSPGAIKRLEPEIRKLCIELIEDFRQDGRCEFVGQFARLFPTQIFMGMMGLPMDRSETLVDWAHQLMHTSNAADPDGAIRGQAVMDIMGMLGELIQARRDDPRDDIVTAVVQAKVDGEPISDDDLLQICFLLYMGGLDTVAGELGAFFRHLALFPEHRRVVVEDPSRIPTVTEELLRAYSIVSTGRVVTRDVEWHGCPMKQGHRVLLPTPAADRDPAEFDDPTTVRFDRARNRHMAFGAGPHRCLGSYLARAELTVALEEWHARIPDYRIEDPTALVMHAGGVAGYDRLPLVWS